MGELLATAAIPATPRGPAAARHLVRAVLTGWELEHVSGWAELVVSELVTNAYRHAPGTDTFELEVTRKPERLELALADGSAIRPVVAELDNEGNRGRGMRIVAELADGWGAEDHGGGKRVWVELPT
jgi:anti-sigma regulatory factor (Ser/Thr protein kinase)